MKSHAFDNLRDFPIRRKGTDGLEHTLGLDRTQSLSMLAIDRIVPNPNQPRRYFSVAKMEELVTSIRERGVLQAIRVREIRPNETYEIVAGERRWRAAKEVGLKEIPALIVQDQTPEQAYIDAIIENIHREDLNPIDRAEALLQVRVHLGGRSWDEIAKSKLLGISRSQIFNLLGLASLPEHVQEEIRSGTLTEKHGRALRLLQKTPDLFEKAHRAIQTKHLSGDDALALVKALRDSAEPIGAARVLRITYRSEVELIGILEAKLRDLKPKIPSP